MFNSDLDVFARIGFEQTAGRIKDELDKKDAKIEKLQAALSQVAAWEGFPETGLFWDSPENTRPMSYSAAYGSNGERDFMRQIAREALAP